MSIVGFLSGATDGYFKGRDVRNSWEDRKRRQKREDRRDTLWEEDRLREIERQRAAAARTSTEFDWRRQDRNRAETEREELEGVYGDAAAATRESLGRGPRRPQREPEATPAVETEALPPVTSTKDQAVAPRIVRDEAAPSVRDRASGPDAPIEGRAPRRPGEESIVSRRAAPPPSTSAAPGSAPAAETTAPRSPRRGPVVMDEMGGMAAPGSEAAPVPPAEAEAVERGRRIRPPLVRPGEGEVPPEAAPRLRVADALRSSGFDDGLASLLERGHTAMGRAGARWWDAIGPQEAEPAAETAPPYPTGGEGSWARNGGNVLPEQRGPVERWWDAVGPANEGPARPAQPVAPAADVSPARPMPETRAGMPVPSLPPQRATGGRAPLRPEALSEVASETAAAVASPAVDAAAQAAARVMPQGRGPDRPMTEAQRERGTDEFVEHYLEVGAPMVMEALISKGRVKEAREFREFLDQETTRAGLRDWSRAMVSASVDDFDGFAENIVKAYNRLDYFGDDTTIVEKDSHFTRDGEGNITGAIMTFRDETSGNTYERVFEDPTEVIEMGVMLLAPEEAFAWHLEKAQAAEAAEAEEIKTRRDEARKQKEPPLSLEAALKIVADSPDGMAMTPEEQLAAAQRMVAAAQSGPSAAQVPWARRPER